jgi:hypothetical protein
MPLWVASASPITWYVSPPDHEVVGILPHKGVAPTFKREKVFQEIRRPVFSLLEKGPLAESCTYLSYDSLRDLGAEISSRMLRRPVCVHLRPLASNEFPPHKIDMLP